jgi:dephospho-CoA kinase
VTGGIATGKSVVLSELSRLGAVTFSADRIAREIVEPGEPAYEKIVGAFGPSVLSEDGRLNRAALAQRIFADAEERRILESITHPIIMKRLEDRIEAFRANPPNDPPVAAAEIPLLFEVGAESLVDAVLVVAVELPVQIARLKKRTGWADDQVRASIESQLPQPQKIARADWVVSTDRDLNDTLAQTRAFWHHIIQSLKEDPPCH